MADQNDTPTQYTLFDGFRRAGTGGKLLYGITAISGLWVVPIFMEWDAYTKSQQAYQRAQAEGRAPKERQEETSLAPELAHQPQQARQHSFVQGLAQQEQTAGTGQHR